MYSTLTLKIKTQKIQEIYQIFTQSKMKYSIMFYNQGKQVARIFNKSSSQWVLGKLRSCLNEQESKFLFHF